MLRFVIFILLACGSLYAQAATPEEALVRFAMAKDAKELMAVLPNAAQQALLKANPSAREQMLKAFLDWKKKGEDIESVEERTGDDLITLHTKRNETIHFKVGKIVNDGMTAVVSIKMSEESAKGEQRKSAADRMTSVLVWTKFEEGSWRITSLSAGQGFDFESKDFVDAINGQERSRSSANEASAVGNVRTINTANVTYAATYENMGWAPTLQSLGSGTAKDPSPDHAMLIDEVLASGEKSGYVFKYQKLTSETYTISARPKQFGVTGARSFFSDESGVIRATGDDREANVADEPLQ